MTPVRPKSVSQNATLIYPGQSFGPGFGVQQATIASILATINRQNANANFHYANAMRDWKMNADIDAAYNLPVPPPPSVPLTITAKIVYADLGGNELTDANAANGLNYAWLDQSLTGIDTPPQRH